LFIGAALLSRRIPPFVRTDSLQGRHAERWRISTPGASCTNYSKPQSSLPPWRVRPLFGGCRRNCQHFLITRPCPGSKRSTVLDATRVSTRFLGSWKALSASFAFCVSDARTRQFRAPFSNRTSLQFENSRL
jgi:hypothetical protein